MVKEREARWVAFDADPGSDAYEVFSGDDLKSILWAGQTIYNKSNQFWEAYGTGGIPVNNYSGLQATSPFSAATGVVTAPMRASLARPKNNLPRRPSVATKSHEWEFRRRRDSDPMNYGLLTATPRTRGGHSRRFEWLHVWSEELGEPLLLVRALDEESAERNLPEEVRSMIATLLKESTAATA